MPGAGTHHALPRRAGNPLCLRVGCRPGSLHHIQDGKHDTSHKGEKVTIPPGQFALLTTKELIYVPSNAIAFISIRAGIKFQGLVNVSGFHVAPGFRGPLKVAVYEADSRDIDLDQDERVFMIFFTSFVKPYFDGTSKSALATSATQPAAPAAGAAPAGPPVITLPAHLGFYILGNGGLAAMGAIFAAFIESNRISRRERHSL